MLAATTAFNITPAVTDPATEYLAGGELRGNFGAGMIQNQARVLGQSIDDVTRAFGPELYERMILDSAVAGALFKLATGTLNGRVRLVPRVKSVPGRDVTPEQKLSEDITADNRRNLDRLERPIEDVIREMFYALAFGNILAEVVEAKNRVDGKRALHAIVPKPWWSWQFGVDRTGRILGYVSADAFTFVTSRGNSIDARPLLDPAHFAPLVWDARGGGPQGHSILRPCYPWWNEKRQALPDYRRFTHRFASPKPVITEVENPFEQVAQVDAAGVATGNYETMVSALLRLLLAWNNDSGVVLPKGCKLEIVEPKSDGKAFENFNTYCDKQITHAILQSARAVMEAEFSSKADAKVAAEGVGSIYQFLAAWLGRWLEGILWRLNVANYGVEPAYLYTPEVRVGQTSDEDTAAKMNAYGFLGFKIHPSQFPAIDAELGLVERDTSQDDLAAEQALAAQADKGGGAAEQQRAGAKTAKGPPGG